MNKKIINMMDGGEFVIDDHNHRSAYICMHDVDNNSYSDAVICEQDLKEIIDGLIEQYHRIRNEI